MTLDIGNLPERNNAQDMKRFGFRVVFGILACVLFLGSIWYVQFRPENAGEELVFPTSTAGVSPGGGNEPKTILEERKGPYAQIADPADQEWMIEEELEEWQEDSMARLKPLLNGADSELVAHLLEILDTTPLDNEVKVEILDESMKHPDPAIREQVLLSLRERTGEFVEPLLKQGLADDAREVQVRALEVMEIQPDPVRWRLLHMAVESSSEEVQLGAANMLSNEESEEIQGLLVKLLNSPHVSVREMAEFEFGLVGGLDQTLDRIANDPSILSEEPARATPLRFDAESAPEKK